MIFELASDFSAALANVPSDHPKQYILGLLEEAIRRDIHLIDRHWRSARKWTGYKPDYRQCRKAPTRAQQQQGRPALRLAIPVRLQGLGEGRTATARRRQG